ncbi:hypothetical protein EDEG_02195 [Edhazardia aedis USNM 41457]|uniref:Uncharacterized protein n=1 Tax=Edhazardia aedis (strain USNM 41457) TaxID=1003232 RepID=J9DLG1_EDHAE|nr:hypothetical protein EDEG_02195 [Edhazardia aedis USNM 41457]|eukprot:EJW03430.1 hypothetical protein EDEG_02195 [Edhazardia aedis USNM 41457]
MQSNNRNKSTRLESSLKECENTIFEDLGASTTEEINNVVLTVSRVLVIVDDKSENEYYIEIETDYYKIVTRNMISKKMIVTFSKFVLLSRQNIIKKDDFDLVVVRVGKVLEEFRTAFKFFYYSGDLCEYRPLVFSFLRDVGCDDFVHLNSKIYDKSKIEGCCEIENLKFGNKYFNIVLVHERSRKIEEYLFYKNRLFLLKVLCEYKCFVINEDFKSNIDVNGDRIGVINSNYNFRDNNNICSKSNSICSNNNIDGENVIDVENYNILSKMDFVLNNKLSYKQILSLIKKIRNLEKISFEFALFCLKKYFKNEYDENSDDILVLSEIYDKEVLFYNNSLKEELIEDLLKDQIDRNSLINDNDINFIDNIKFSDSKDNSNSKDKDKDNGNNDNYTGNSKDNDNSIDKNNSNAKFCTEDIDNTTESIEKKTNCNQSQAKKMCSVENDNKKSKLCSSEDCSKNIKNTLDSYDKKNEKNTLKEKHSLFLDFKNICEKRTDKKGFIKNTGNIGNTKKNNFDAKITTNESVKNFKGTFFNVKNNNCGILHDNYVETLSIFERKFKKTLEIIEKYKYCVIYIATESDLVVDFLIAQSDDSCVIKKMSSSIKSRDTNNCVLIVYDFIEEDNKLDFDLNLFNSNNRSLFYKKN